MRISDWSADVGASDLGISAAVLTQAGNYMSAMLSGLTLAEARARIGRQIDAERAALDDAARALIEQGLAVWSEDGDRRPVLIVRGQARLIDDAADRKSTRLNSSH